MVRLAKGVSSVRMPSFVASVMVASSLFSIGLLSVGCSSSEDPPTEGDLRINFQNPKAAVVTQKLEIFVFPTTTTCLDLVTRRSATGRWHIDPERSSTPFDTCALVRTPGAVKVPESKFGKALVGVVGTSADGKDLMLGCTSLTFGEGNFNEPVVLTPVNPATASQLMDATPCSSLQRYCGGQCQ